MNHQARDNQQEFEEKVIKINRVSKKTKGGDQMGFSALMVVGDGKGRVGVGLGKAKGVAVAIQKGIKQAKRKMVRVPVHGTTIPFKAEGRFGAGHVLLKPAAPGSGVIAGGSVRAIMEASGIKDVSAKILGSDNQSSSVYATLDAFDRINKIVKVRNITLKKEKKKESSGELISIKKDEVKKHVVKKETKTIKKKLDKKTTLEKTKSVKKSK